MKSRKGFRATILLFALALIIIFPSTDSHAAELLLGDVSDDGVVNSDDAIYLLRHTLMPLSYPISQSGDMDGNGTVNSDDAIYLLRHTLMPDRYPILSCDHDLIAHEARSATCTEIGWDAYIKCRKCSYSTYCEIPALGHSITAYGAKATSCTSFGWDAYECCSRCDYTTYAEIEILPHNYVEGICLDCGELYISPNGLHAHVNKLIPAQSPSCTQVGLSDGIRCTSCGKTVIEQTELPLLPHELENGSCRVCGITPAESSGLLFEEAGDGYILAGIGECADAQVIVPATHNGLAVTAISPSAFDGNSQIVQIVIPSSVSSIGSYAFNRCVNLKSVVFSEGLEKIGSYAFMYCTALEEVSLPNSLDSLGVGTFIACYSLKEVSLGEGLEKLENDVFFECFRMEKVSFSKKPESLGAWVFFDCDSLATIVFPGTADQWNSLYCGKYWDENSGDYTVLCEEGQSVHKHSFGEPSATNTPCLLSVTCADCGIEKQYYSHTEGNWEFSSTSVYHRCTVCDSIFDEFTSADTVIALNFDESVKDELKNYPYFSLVSDGNNRYRTVDGRSVWAINSSTFIDYDKRAFIGLDFYSITFDMMVSSKGSSLRDCSVFSFVPGFQNGSSVGSVGWIWQIKYLPLLDRLSTKPLNSTSGELSYGTVDEIPNLSEYNDTNGISFNEGVWATVSVVCDVNYGRSYVFVDGQPIGSVATFDYNDAKYSNAFSMRFCDNTAFGILIDNFRICEITAK